ncbi:sigma-54-dependent transcriptional regulator [Nitrospira sp. T9]|uniref:sigma-54-dependent transcriptional regulator n=1 Tax=unclassified Nitrospira TaxID=2652172 RepID=UPI003F96F01D
MDAFDSAESAIAKQVARILLVEDEVDVRESIKLQLEDEGHQVVDTESGGDALVLAESSQFDIVLTDVMIPDINGIELVQRITQLPNHPVMIVMTGYGSVEMAVKAIKAGAFDFLSKPFSMDVLSATLASALRVKSLQDENVELKKTVKGQFSLGKLISSSQVMQEVFQLIDCVADTDSTVLILGESGTGKELIAQTIHCHSTRRQGSLIPVNCGAIPEALLESELFGHEKGAFTGAVASRVGRFELATGGTIFLDEIGDLSPPLQVKLLRVLQERTFERVGGTRTYKSDARVIAATNQDLETLVAAKQFREDLFYRLNVVPVLVPPLRHRVEDIPLLLQHFITMFNDRRKAELTGVADDAMSLLCEYPWPGNVRELGNIVERIAILKRRGMIVPEDLPEKIRRLPSSHLPTMPAAIPVAGMDLSRTVEEFENRLILEALERTNWVKSKAARLLQINRTTLIEKLKKKSLAEVVAQRATPSEDLADV